MEQTVNQFNKGLQMDTNPMVQGQDTLSDALNATFVTMNGNEVILQNDMGNRRVDNAYLPPGYEPVGIKEYGGVIYIAAYNPITNHSQIGSFPSPERKIDYNDDNSLKSDFDFENFVSTTGGNIITDSELKIPVMINDSFLIPLTKTNTLHVGDKFVVYAPGFSEMKDDISNYDNIDYSESDKVYSPKNRKYTIQIGVLNEQNNFNDITKYLVRWDDESPGNIIKDLGNKSDLYKFNKGYFIPDGFTSQTDIEGNTIDDTNLILSRKQIVANTFSYKLAGPLYLKTEYNHISNFGFKYTGKRNSSNNIELTIEGYFTYNCPDGVINGSSVDDNDYYTYALNVKNLSTDYINFDLYDNNGEIVYKRDPIIKEGGEEEIKFLSHTYDKINNQYKVVLTKKYELQYNENNPIFKYIIGVKGGTCSDNNKDFYIKGLSSKGEINLNLLNSGELNLRQYKFYNKASSQDTIMLLNFESYPKVGESFENLYLEFKNINNNDISDSNSHYLYTEQPILNGQQIINFNWEKSLVDIKNNEYPLQPRKTYEIKIHYTHKTESENKKVYKENINRWFLTTELFNDLYSTNIADFCTTQDERITNKIITFDNNNVDFELTYGNPYLSNDVTLYSNTNDSIINDSIKVYCPVDIKATTLTMSNIIQQLPFDVTINNNIINWNTTMELDVPINTQRRSLIAFYTADTIENIIEESNYLLLIHGLAQDVAAGGNEEHGMWSREFRDADTTELDVYYSENLNLQKTNISVWRDAEHDNALIGNEYHNSKFTNHQVRYQDNDDDNDSISEFLTNVFLGNTSFNLNMLNLIPTLLVVSVDGGDAFINTKYKDSNGGDGWYYTISKKLLFDSKNNVIMIYNDIKNQIMFNFLNPKSVIYSIDFKLSEMDTSSIDYNNTITVNVNPSVDPYSYGNLKITVNRTQTIPVTLKFNTNKILDYLFSLQYRSSIKYYNKQTQTLIEDGEITNSFGTVSIDNISYFKKENMDLMYVDGDASARYTLKANVAKINE